MKLKFLTLLLLNPINLFLNAKNEKIQSIENSFDVIDNDSEDSNSSIDESEESNSSKIIDTEEIGSYVIVNPKNSSEKKISESFLKDKKTENINEISLNENISKALDEKENKESEKPKANNEDDKKETSTENIATLSINKSIESFSQEYAENDPISINEDKKNQNKFINYIATEIINKPPIEEKVENLILTSNELKSLENKMKESEKPKANNEDDKKETSTENIATLSINKSIESFSQEYAENDPISINEDKKNQNEFIDYIATKAKNGVEEIINKLSVEKKVEDLILTLNELKSLENKMKESEKPKANNEDNKKETSTENILTLNANKSIESFSQEYDENDPISINEEKKNQNKLINYIATEAKNKAEKVINKPSVEKIHFSNDYLADSDIEENYTSDEAIEAASDFVSEIPAKIKSIFVKTKSEVLNKEKDSSIETKNKIVDIIPSENIRKKTEEENNESLVEKNLSNEKKMLPKKNEENKKINENSLPSISKIINYLQENKKVSFFLSGLAFMNLFYLIYKLNKNNDNSKVDKIDRRVTRSK